MLRQGIQGISDLIAVPAMINLDFADVKTIMKEKGMAHMGIGSACGENRASEAARQAVESPLLETSIKGAKGILMNITGGSDLSLLEVNEAAEIIAENADPEANIIFGADIDESMGDAIRITVIATGFDRPEETKSDLQMGGAPARRSFTDQRPFGGFNANTAPASAQNAFSARAYAEPEKGPDPVMNGEPQQPKQPEQPLYRDPSANVRKDYSERPANKLDIPAFLRK